MAPHLISNISWPPLLAPSFLSTGLCPVDLRSPPLPYRLYPPCSPLSSHPPPRQLSVSAFRQPNSSSPAVATNPSPAAVEEEAATKLPAPSAESPVETLADDQTIQHAHRRCKHIQYTGRRCLLPSPDYKASHSPLLD